MSGQEGWAGTVQEAVFGCRSMRLPPDGVPASRCVASPCLPVPAHLLALLLPPAPRSGVPIIGMSAMTGEGVGMLLPAAAAMYRRWNQRVPTSHLNRWVEKASRHAPASRPLAAELGSTLWLLSCCTRSCLFGTMPPQTHPCLITRACLLDHACQCFLTMCLLCGLPAAAESCRVPGGGRAGAEPHNIHLAGAPLWRLHCSIVAPPAFLPACLQQTVWSRRIEHPLHLV